MLVNFYNFSKRENSTAQPPASALIKSTDCYLKDGCSILAPSIRLAWAADDMMPNYAQIPAWGRFYNITNIEYQGSAIIIDMAVDVLASYKDQIGASTQYVVRAASEKDDTMIDTLYPTSMLPTVLRSNTPNTIFDSDGCFILGVAGGTGSNVTPANARGLSYYILDSTMMAAFANYANSWTAADDFLTDFNNTIQVTADAAVRQLMRVYDYVKTCFWIPLSPDLIWNTALRKRIALGGFLCPLANGSGYEVKTFNVTARVASFTLPAHPDAATLGRWVNASTYSEHYVDVPFLGEITVPVGMLTAGNTIAVDVDISVLDGSAQFYVKAIPSTGMEIILNRIETHIGVAVPINVIQSNILGTAGSIVGSVASAITGNFLGAASGIASAVQSAVPAPQTIGGLSGYHISEYGAQLVSTFWRIPDTDNTNHGSPLCARRQISTLSGYVQTEGAALALAATEDEKSAILRQMDSGFFYE